MTTDIEKFEKDMEVFDFRMHQEVLTYFNHLKSKGWTINDVRNWVKGRKRQTLDKAGTPVIFKCPECKAPMMLLPVNTDISNQTGDASKSVLICNNSACMHTIYSRESVGEIIKNMLKKGEIKCQD